MPTMRKNGAAIAATALLLRSLLSPQQFFASCEAAGNDGGSRDAGGHELRGHLAPRQYGAGLRRSRRRHRNPSRADADDDEGDDRRPADRPRRPGGRPRPNDNGKPSGGRRPIKVKLKDKDKEGVEGGKNDGSSKPTDGKLGNGESSGKLGNGSGDSGKKPADVDGRPQQESPSSGPAPASRVLERLSSASRQIDDELFLYETPTLDWEPSSIYKHAGLSRGLEVMNGQGVAGMFYYLGEEGDGDQGWRYGLTNVAAFVAQSMKETIKYNACDENNWDLYDEGYPVSNSCGQLGQSYQDYKCPEGEEHMECDVDPDMEMTAVTNAKWYGAPAPFYCGPKKDKDDFTGKWNFGMFCNLGWLDPPQYCDVYEGQKAGGFVNDRPVANRNGRTDVEGCCWWGRGVIQTTGICNFGKLNYYLGKRAAAEGRKTPYGEIDFCKDPEAICSSTKFKELKWIAGMFYWMESVQKYDSGGWNYMERLREFVDGGFQDRSFIDSVSGIVNRGCHNPPCGTGAVDGGDERHHNFVKALATFGLIDAPNGSEMGKGGGGGASLLQACGVDHVGAAESCPNPQICQSSLDCPPGQHCWAIVSC